MSFSASEKQAIKSKSKKTTTTTKSSKFAKGGKEAPVNDKKFRGEGVHFKCKLLGVAEVDGPRGDSMCIAAIKKLKQHIKQTGEHKPKIILNVTLYGIRILEDKTKNVLFEHPVNKVSFITHDPDDKKIFSFISSARCSAGNVGHMMYAIKYDKVAGIITATLYELFQAVFKIRQEAAQKQRKAVPKPPIPDNTSQPSTVSNGPSQASSINDNNIYEEPSSTLTLPTDVSANCDSTSHYQTPTPRPLPPAPYSSPQASPIAVKQDTKENTAAPDQVMNSSVSDNMFGASVFSQPDHSALDNVSVPSVDLIRKESISSSVSSSSETASFDAKSLDLKSTPPAIARTRPTISSSSPDKGVDEVKPIPEYEDNDYETIPASDYETIPSDIVAKNTVDKAEANAGFNFKETFTEDDESFPVSFSSSNSEMKTNNVELSAEKPEPKSTISEESPPSSAVFSNDDFFSSHFDDKSKSEHAPTTDFPVDDPFAPTLNTTLKESKTNEPFATGEAFESAFSSGKMSPLPFEREQDNDAKCEADINSNKTVEKDMLKTEAFASSSAFDTAFGSSESSPRLSKPMDDIVGENPNREKPSSEEPMTELSWDNAFGENKAEDNKGVTPKLETSWSAVFEDNETPSKGDHKMEEPPVIFPWDDSFGAKLDSEESDKGQQPDKVAPEPDLSWTNAFSDKPAQEVKFAWGDAFGGQTDSKDGKTDNGFGGNSFNDAFGGQTDSKGGKKDDDFCGNSFNDAFGGQTDSKGGKKDDDFCGNSFNDAFGGQTDSKGGKKDDDFCGNSFNDAFGRQTDSKDGKTDNDFGGNSSNDTFGGQTDSKGGKMDNDFGGNSSNDAFGGQTDSKDGKTDNDFGGNSFNDAFGGQTDSKDGKTDDDFGGNSLNDAFGGQTDSKDGKMDNGFGGNSFNDAFGGQTDSKDGKTDDDFGGNSLNDAFGGQTDSKGGKMDNDFGGNSFNDAFSSTTFQVTNTKNERSPNKFGVISTPIKADTPENETNDTPNTSQEGKDVLGDDTPKDKAEDEDLSGSDKEKDDEKFLEDVEKIATSRTIIPQIIEPIEEDDSDDELVRPVTLSISPTKPRNGAVSPSVPPPLPPRPMAPLPSLPPRPRTYSTPVKGEIPPTPPRPAGSMASPILKTGTPKRLPPALPPRVDLQSGKARSNSALVVSSSTRAVSDQFSSPKSTLASVKNETSWQANWPSETTKQDKKESNNSKNSPDPFGDEFFTDFNVNEAKTANDKTNSNTTQDKKNFFSDPFVGKEGKQDMFQADFGGVDPFADFLSNNTNIDPFTSHGGDVFPGFSSNKDPFGDSNDPFADKGALNDPFTLSPKKGDNDRMSFQLSKDSADGDFADSFA